MAYRGMKKYNSENQNENINITNEKILYFDLKDGQVVYWRKNE